MSRLIFTTLSLAALAATAVGAAAIAQTPQPGRAAPQAKGPAQAVDHADFSQDSNWVCRPGRQDACTIPLDASVVAPNGSVKRETFVADPNAPIDCFYVYPTVSNDAFSSSDLVAGPEERAVVRSQLARLGSKCKLYAPMYRQTTLTQLRAAQTPGATPPTQRGAPGQGTADVDDAWDYYLKHDNKGRGVVLIGHSQGAGQITRLIRAKVEGQPVQKQIVSALIIGSGVQVAKGRDVGGTFQSIPACRKPDQIGCVVSYGSYRDTVTPPATGQAVGAGNYGGDGPNEGLCVNPAALAGGKATAKGYWVVEAPLNSATKAPPRWSATTPLYTGFASTPGLVTTECVKKGGKVYLEVHVNADTKDARADDVYGDVMTANGVNPGWGLHNLDMNIGMGSFVDLLGSQAKAYAKANR